MKNITLALIILIALLTLSAQGDIGYFDLIARSQDTSSNPGRLEIMMHEDQVLQDDRASLPASSSSSRDLYFYTVSNQLGSFGFKSRGYSSDAYETGLNGLLMNDVRTGVSFFSSGLNDVFEHSNLSFGLKAGSTGPGKSGGISESDYTAAGQRRQTSISYTQANRSYNSRIAIAHHTGMMQNGWAVSVAAAHYWANNGYVEGTGNNNYSYYFGVSRQIGKKSLVHFFTLGSAGTTARAGAAIQEVYDLAGTNFYNPLWGYQNGEKRSADISKSYQPLYALQYEYNPDSTTHAQLTLSYQSDYIENSGLDWYNAPDPRPDYYKKLPSYYTNDPATADLQKGEQVRQLWLNDQASRQINWDNLYEVNTLNTGMGNGLPGLRSVYVLGADRDDNRKYNIAASFWKIMNAHLKVNAGLTFMAQHTESYRKMIDLLGGDYYLNLNQFAEQTYPSNNVMKQIDMNQPDRLIRVGDKYAHDYVSRFIKSFIWANVACSFRKIDFFLASRIGYDAFSRDGLFRNGLFPDSSFGKSGIQQFITWQLKGGIMYKINGRQILFLNAGLMNDAPAMDHTFISPKTRNSVVGNIATEKVANFEAGYRVNTAKVEGSVSIFTTDISNATDIRRFYYEGYNTFVNYVMQNIDIRHIGAELALQVKIIPALTAIATATWMQVFYRSNPQGSLYRDNDTTAQVAQHIAYLKNYNVASGSQSAYTLGFNYRSDRKWQVGINFNFTDRNYVDLNPLRHTEEAVDMLQAGSSQEELVLRQEQLPSAFTTDVFAGKIIALNKMMKWLPRKTSLAITAGISNLFNRKDIRTRGYDQLRFDYDTQNPELFPAKYTYSPGACYFVKCMLRF